MRILDDDVDDTPYLFDWDTIKPKIKLGFWTEDREDELRRLWETDATASQIAKQLGTTRNAVIGKANRLFLSHRGPEWQRLGAELNNASLTAAQRSRRLKAARQGKFSSVKVLKHGARHDDDCALGPCEAAA